MRKMKKALMGIFAATMVMASAFTAAAATTTTSSGASSNSGSSSSTVVEITAESVREAGAVINVAGSSVRTTIAGGYAAEKVQGVAVTTPLADVRSALGLASNQTPYIIVYDTDAKKSNLAMASVNAAAEALGANVVASINVELGAKQGGKFVSLTDGSIGMVVGIPKASIDATKTYSMVCVQPGGVTTILEDKDSNPNTVTFEVKAGLATYAIVAK